MSLFDEMVNDFGSGDASTNAVHEVMQQIALAGLARGGCRGDGAAGEGWHHQVT